MQKLEKLLAKTGYGQLGKELVQEIRDEIADLERGLEDHPAKAKKEESNIERNGDATDGPAGHPVETNSERPLVEERGIRAAPVVQVAPDPLHDIIEYPDDRAGPSESRVRPKGSIQPKGQQRKKITKKNGRVASKGIVHQNGSGLSHPVDPVLERYIEERVTNEIQKVLAERDSIDLADNRSDRQANWKGKEREEVHAAPRLPQETDTGSSTSEGDDIGSQDDPNAANMPERLGSPSQPNWKRVEQKERAEQEEIRRSSERALKLRSQADPPKPPLPPPQQPLGTARPTNASAVPVENRIGEQHDSGSSWGEPDAESSSPVSTSDESSIGEVRAAPPQRRIANILSKSGAR
ncbi:MAG: hypothetical protein M1819_002166 [Sarea resinae]|nr:MAG: hypothetical protein M1819_002166 [Sarea resinae]